MVATLVGEFHHLTLEMWIQDSSPATRILVGVERSIGYGLSYRSSEGSWDM
jgi:hypothetical protein